MTNDTDCPATATQRRRPKKTAGASPVTAATDVTSSAPAAALTASVWPPSAAPEAPTKSASVIKLLMRARGATSLELVAATDWQPHSIRAFLSGLRKKGRVLVRKERKGNGFAYHIEALAPATAEPSQPVVGDGALPTGDPA